ERRGLCSPWIPHRRGRGAVALALHQPGGEARIHCRSARGRGARRDEERAPQSAVRVRGGHPDDPQRVGAAGPVWTGDRRDRDPARYSSLRARRARSPRVADRAAGEDSRPGEVRGGGGWTRAQDDRPREGGRDAPRPAGEDEGRGVTVLPDKSAAASDLASSLEMGFGELGCTSWRTPVAPTCGSRTGARP